MESLGNVRKITVELPTYLSHRAPHIHSMELLTYTWSTSDNHMGRHTIWGDCSHAQILYVWRFNCIRDPWGKSNLAFHLSLQYCVSLPEPQRYHRLFLKIGRSTNSHQEIRHNFRRISRNFLCSMENHSKFEGFWTNLVKISQNFNLRHREIGSNFGRSPEIFR
jgi:hypothetical protein